MISIFLTASDVVVKEKSEKSKYKIDCIHEPVVNSSRRPTTKAVPKWRHIQQPNSAEYWDV